MEETASKQEFDISLDEYIGELKHSAEAATDEDLIQSDNYHMMEHNENYTKLLNCYVNNLDRTLTAKYWFKIIFFGFIIVAIIVVLDIFTKSIHYALRCEEMANAITAIIGGFVSLISATIVLPTIIAKYLFNSDEEKDALKIIEKVQDFDKIIRKHEEREG